MADFTGPQPQQAIPGTPPKGIGQPCRYLLVQDGRLVVALEQEVSVWCKAQLDTRHGGRAIS